MKLPSVRKPDEILDMLFKSAARVQAGGKDPLSKMKAKSIRKLHAISDKADRELSRYVVGFPSFERSKFEWEIADLLVGADRLKISIARVHGCKNSIVTITNRIARGIAKSQSIPRIHALRDEAYGRVASLIEGAADDFNFLAEASEKLREVPELQPDDSVVIAGFPNVGKSMLISSLSNARTRVEAYPFTTTRLIVGHRLVGYRKVQFVDCPGLTERAFETRNVYERKALLAVRHLANILVYLVDGSGTCGYPVEEQLKMFETIRKEFAPEHYLLVYSKADLYDAGNEVSVSSITRQGIEGLVSEIGRLLDEKDGSRRA